MMNTHDDRFQDDSDERRSIRALRLTPLRDVEKQKGTVRTRATQPPLSYRDPNGERPLNIERPRRASWGWMHTAFTIGSIVLLGVLLYPILFPKATVTVIPRVETIGSEGAVYTASKSGDAGVRYTLVPVVLQDTASVPATQKKQVQEKAHGIITVTNAAVNHTQRLIKNTRFQSSTGNVYRIRESIEVPAYTIKDGVKKPGTLAVEVFADEAGESYNLEKGTLTLPGLKGKQDLYEGITAVVKSPIAGGSTGTKFVISESERTTAVQKMTSGLLERARAQAKEKIPADSFVIPGADAYTVRQLPDEENGTNVVLGVEVTYNTMLFTHADFAAYMREQSMLADLPDSPARIQNAGALTATLTAHSGDASPFAQDSVSFTLHTAPVVVWNIDADALKHSLGGVARAAIQDILKKDPTIGPGTKVDIMPFWNNTMPKESRITVIVSAPTEQKK